MRLYKNIIIILIFMIYLAGTLSVHAQEFKVKNLKVEWSDDSKLIITYDLSSPEDKKIDIKIFLMSNDDPGFKIEVKSASGKIGSGKFSGSGNEVVWEIYSDYPDLKEGESYYFVLEASVIEEDSGGWPWYYYVGGAVIAGAATLLITNTPESSSGSADSGFPTPPDRN
ncbi:MAG: hypothetical protein IH949_13135 [Bacteroidetes bacterium]|nr:hypothetical protein [Bacteroidota bacterium]